MTHLTTAYSGID